MTKDVTTNNIIFVGATPATLDFPFFLNLLVIITGRFSF